MKQALHILKKDISYLRYDIGITLLAAVAFLVGGVHHMPAVDTFLPVTWWFLIARVIHAEPLPGHRHFWLTRPYRWQSLLTAKLLFILAFVNLPLLVADAVILRSAGFAIGDQVPGLLWSQVLLTVAFVLPVAAFSAITSGLAELLTGSLLIVIGVLAKLLFSFWIPGDVHWLALEWVPTYCLVAQAAAGAAIILLWQYRWRNTAATRGVGAITALLLLATGTMLPWTGAFHLQTWFSPRNIAPALRITLDSDRSWLGHVYATEEEEVAAELPLHVSGLPAGMEMRPDGLKVAVLSSTGRTLNSDQTPPSAFTFEANIVSIRVVMSKATFAEAKTQSVRLRGRLFFTLYGNKHNLAIPLNRNPVLVTHDGICSADLHFVSCQSIFRVPSEVVVAHVSEESPRGPKEVTAPLFARKSYSPLPADFRIDPLVGSFFSPHADKILEAGVEVWEPLAHIAQDFEINQVHLNDFATRPSMAALQ